MEFTVPVNLADIAKFLEKFGSRYQAALNEIKANLNEARKELPALSCIYSIYSRSDKQHGHEYKSTRKIRLKIHDYCSEHGITKYNIYQMPDIVGITVAVLYPSDINVVNSYIDGLCKSGKYVPINSSPSPAGEIRTAYGTVMQEKGYHACHYRLKKRNADSEPIVEIQVKTVLHDAWGLKTHDLTYKNESSIDELVLAQFNILGDVLAKLDTQSDVLRSSISKAQIARKAKLRSVQLETILSTAKLMAKPIGAVDGSSITALELSERIENIHKAGKINNIGNAERQDITELAIKFFDKSPECCCLILSAFAAVTEDAVVKSIALERISMWEAAADDLDKRMKAMLFSHLAYYCVSDTPAAIDIAEEAIHVADDLIAKATDAKVAEANQRRKNSFVSSLAYYHAELIGSDEGRKRKAAKRAGEYLHQSMKCLVDLGLIGKPDEPIEEIIERVKDDGNAERLHHSIDNAIFVMIQTAVSSPQVREALRLLDLQKKKRPASLGTLPQLLHELHEHHGRIKLFELETAEISA